ncbi:MAG: cytochrome P450 [Acidimicrobiia bacterium]
MSVKYSQYDHHDPQITLGNVHQDWDDLRAQCPIGRSEAHDGMWVVTGFPEACEILGDPRRFSSCPVSIPPFPQAAPMVPVEIDPPNHARYRAMLGAPFSVRRAEAYAEPLRLIVNDLIDDFVEAGSCDIYQAMAVRLPAALATIMLGTPADDADKLQEWVDTIVHEITRDLDLAVEAVEGVYQYFWDVLERRQADPSGDDLISLLVRAELDGEKLTEEELLGFCLFLLLASTDTTQKAIGSMFWHLGADPDLRHRIASDPTVTPLAVEEFLRFWGPVLNARRATSDAEVGGVKIREGDRILVALGAANRDEREFPGAGQFVIDRTPNRHITFGSSIHKCLGAHIARVELRVMLDEFLRRIPDFEIADESRIAWSTGQVQGVVRLPIRFPPGPRENRGT